MASEIRVDKINSLSGVGTVTLSPTGVDVSGICTATTFSGVTATLSGTVTANAFTGDGGGLTNIVGSGSGTVIQNNGTNVGTAGTIDFGSGLNVSAVSAGVATVTTSFVTPEKFGAIAKPVIEAETRTWYNAMSTKPKREHLRSMDMLVKRLKWSGIWTELDTLYAFASHNKADSLINVKNPGTANLTETATATFTAGKGFTAGSNGRLATSANFNTFASQYTINAAHIGVFMLDEGQRDDSPIAGIADGTEDGYIIPHRASSNHFRGRVSTSTGDSFPNTNSSGSFILSRNSSTAIVAYRNGFEIGTTARTVEAVPTNVLEVLNITGNDGSGTIGFLHTGDKLDESKTRAFAWILQEYVNEVEQGYDEGSTVAATSLDVSVTLSTNTTAMQNFLNVAVGTTVGLLSDETYLVNDKLSIPDSPNIQGVIGKSTIKADSTMSNTKPVIVQGSKDNQSIGGKIDGLIVDYNVDRTSSSGGLSEDTDGNAFSLHNVQGGRYTNITGMSARKHGFDILGNTYNRSGSSGTYNQRLKLTSRDIYVDNIIGMGNGDDGFSTHGAEYITGGYVWGEFARATYSTSNSNGIEIDDYSRYINIEDAGGRFAHRAVEIKGHNDAHPAEHIHIGRVFSEHCAMGLTIRHLDHDESTITPGAGDVRIEEVYVRAPVDWSLGSGISECQAALIYSYDRVSIGNFIGRCEGADKQVTTQVLQVISGANNFNADRVDIVGFTSALEGVDMSGITTGYAMYGSIRIDDSSTDKAVEISDDVDVVIGSYAISKTGTPGNTGIHGYSGHIQVGAGVVKGYSTATNTSN